MEAELITATKHEDGTTTVDKFPHFVKFSSALLTMADPNILRTEITLDVANGSATYVVTGGDERIFEARRVSLLLRSAPIPEPDLALPHS